MLKQEFQTLNSDDDSEARSFDLSQSSGDTEKLKQTLIWMHQPQMSLLCACCCPSSKSCLWSTVLHSPEVLQWRGFSALVVKYLVSGETGLVMPTSRSNFLNKKISTSVDWFYCWIGLVVSILLTLFWSFRRSKLAVVVEHICNECIEV